MEDLKGRTVRAGFAQIMAQAAGLLLRLVSIVILSRLLEPADFGLVTMVTAVSGAYALFATAGLSAATVQRTTVSDEQLSTLFWINVAVGTALGLLCAATAPVLVKFYHEERLFWIAVVVAAGFPITGAGVQHYALLERQLKYGAISTIAIVSQAAGLLVAISMAASGFGYWSLVTNAVVPPAVSTLSLWAATRWLPGRPRRDSDIGSMLRFGGTITLNTLVAYLAYNSEKILLGRSWGADALGLYGRAYQLVNLPTAGLNDAIGAVAFSSLSRVRHDPARYRSYFLKGYSLVISLTLPTTIFAAIWADDLVRLVLGPKWLDASIVFRLLAPTIFIFGLINPLGWLMTSSGLQVRSLTIALVIAPLVISAYVIGLPFGPTGVATSFSVAMTIWLVPHMLWCVHGTVISMRDLLAAISRPLVSGIVAAGFTSLTYFALHDQLVPLLRLIIGGSVMVASYGLVLLFAMRQWTFYIGLLSEITGRPVSIGQRRADSARHRPILS
ncbi:lipopolysaccharide biosynthesis protein [Bradyrhizobium guangdongense]|uniref:lipopolysaccharide biosynthesis protein n=1 Tax=Bradyrhizobium guangdongense TaxID=1325090 RepID=UPI001319C48B|nr:lipopolysaccharide biosynthesis protein [Bradyrhizobium guangdongense]